MTESSLKLELQDYADVDGQQALFEYLKASRLKPIVVGASGIRKLNFLTLEVLVAAKLQWQKDEVTFQLENIDQAFLENLSTLELNEIFERAPKS